MERGYYWIAVNEETGEIAEKNRGYSSEEGAYRAALKYIREEWSGNYNADVLIEIWSYPYAYTVPQHTLPMSSKRYRIEEVNCLNLQKMLHTFGVDQIEGRKIIDSCLRDSNRWRFIEGKDV